jgi:hypothetical protein
MYIQQTKVESRATGGPQYYLQKVPAHIKEFLRKRGACPVVLQTPYGIAGSTFTAVGGYHKLNEKGDAVAGKVGHDRIQRKKTIIQNDPERITNAAVKLTDGSIFIGLAHGYALEKAWAAHKKTPESVYFKLFDKSKDGFMTSRGRFVSRKTAYNLAVKNQQMTQIGYSQAVKDLWGYKVQASDELGALAFNNARSNNRKE